MSTETPRREDVTYYLLPRRRWPLFRWAFWTLFTVATLTIAAFQFKNSALEYALNPENQTQETKDAALVTAPEPLNLPDRPINVLILGSDSRGEAGGRSDSMILLRLDFKRQFVSQLSFPRDLYVDIPGYGRNKINAAYSLGKTKLTIETVNQLVGEKITYFFNVDFEAFRQLVNKSGGVYIDVDRYYFNDNSGLAPIYHYEPINIKPGYQKLSGFDALDYVRFRHSDTDNSRIIRQQNFLAEMKRTQRSARGINNILDVVHDHVQTNLTKPKRLEDFLRFGMGVEKVGKFSMPIAGGDSIAGVGDVQLLDRDKLPAVLDAWKNPEFQSDQNTELKSDPTKQTVVVYNGSQRSGLANQVGQALKSRGYNVLVGNSAPDGTYASTSVFYAPKKRDDAKVLANLFGPTASLGERRPEMTTEGDLIVVVGSDFAGVKNKWPVTSSPAGSVTGSAQTAAKPEIVRTSAMASRISEFRRQTGANFLVPTHLPTGSQVVYVRKYNLGGSRGARPNTMVIVLKMGTLSKAGGGRYVTIMQTRMKDPPIISTATGKKGGFYTFYDGKTMQRLLWQRGDMTYWITNSLDGGLTDITIRDMAKFMVPPGKVKKAVGPRGVTVNVSDESRTP